MVIMERILLFYALVVVAIIKPTTCTTAQTTTEIMTGVVTVDSTESTPTTSAMTSTAMTTDVRATTSSSFTTSDPSNTDTTTGADSTISFTTNPSSSSSSSMTTVHSVGSTLTPSSLISTMTTDGGTTSSSLTTSGPDSTTDTTTGDASTISFTTNPSSSSSSSMTTVSSVGSTLTPSSLISTMTTDGGTTSSSLTTSGPDSTTDTTTGDASTISFTTNPSSSSSSSMTTVSSVGSTLTPSSLISTMTTDGGTTSSSLTTSGPDSTTDTNPGDASTISFTTNPSSSSSSSMTTVHSVRSTLIPTSLSTDGGTTTPSPGTTTEQDRVTTPDDANTIFPTTNTIPSSSSPLMSNTPLPSSSPLTSNTYSTEIVTDGETTLAASTSSSSSSPITTTEILTQSSPSSPSPITTTEKTEQSSLSSSASPATSADMTEATDMTTSTSNTTSNTSNQSSPTEAPTEAPTVPPTARPTDPPAEPTTRPKVGPVPEPTFPEIDDDAEKTYQFEFAVEEDTAAGCESNDLSSNECVQFKNNITEELIDVYGEIDGFKGIEVGLRAGSIIVNHTVIYTYNDMTDEDRQSSAQSIYDQTLGQAVVGGKLGNYTVIEDCENCAPPEETSNICGLNETTCPAADFSEPTCTNNYWVCESECKTSYCSGHGICWQEDLKSQPICSCDWDNGEWYWGYKCQFYANEMHLIIGCSCGAAVLLVLIVSCIAYVCTHTNNKTEKATVASSENGDDDVIHAFRNLGYDQDHTTETANFPPIEDLDEGDILQRSRPYSYIYRARGDDNANTDSTLIIKNQNGGAQRESKLEVNDDAAAKRLSNGSSDTRHSSFLKSNGGYQQRSTEFWGNVDETSASEAIKLEPVLDHIDLNESYKIQRPRISTNYSYSNTATPNAYQSIGSNDHEYETHFIPQPDYTQR